VVPFEALKPSSIEAMTRKELMEAVGREGIRRLGLQVTFSEDLVQHLAQAGFSATLGARPLQRTIENTVIANLATWIVECTPASGSRVHVDWVDGKLVLR
jgi:ATP-dependent Clp protease ATP-binding subunit ClpC